MTRRWEFFLGAGLCAALASAAMAQDAIPTSTAPGVELRALDKLSGQAQTLTIDTGQTAQIGTLEITLRECRYPEGNQAGDAYAGMTIRERGQEVPAFEGWMIASAPALSALDHARYDVWVIRCLATS